MQELLSKLAPLTRAKTIDHSGLSGEYFMPELGILLSLPTSAWLGSEALHGFIAKMMGKCGSVDLSAPGGAEYMAMYPLWEEFCRDHPEVGPRQGPRAERNVFLNLLERLGLPWHADRRIPPHNTGRRNTGLVDLRRSP